MKNSGADELCQAGMREVSSALAQEKAKRAKAEMRLARAPSCQE